MSKASTFTIESTMKSYLPLMHELAIRIDLVAKACDGKLNLTPPYAYEYSYFQFRRMCELIAMGSLLLHGDLELAKSDKAKKEWNAEKIMKRLKNGYEGIFPQSVIRTIKEGDWHVECNAKPNALTFDEFNQLYISCGNVLHRGTIKKLESEKDFTQKDYEKVISWQRKIVDLMNEHFIGRSEGKGYYITSLRTESGYPECSVFTIKGAGQVEVSTHKMTVNDDVIHSYVSNKHL